MHVLEKQLPDQLGHFGSFGGQHVPEALQNVLRELEEAYHRFAADPSFQKELTQLLHHYSGRPTPLYYAERLTKHFGGAPIYLKREDLNHTGAHKINNALGQGLLAKRMGKTEVIAETGAGQHGVATATVAALLGLSCKVFMGEEDMERQRLNVYRMQLLGAEVVPATSGTKTLKDAVDEAIKYWIAHVDETFYLLGSAVGPHPYPLIVRNFQRIIGDEARKQILEQTGSLPGKVIACVGGGSNAIGLFYPFLQDDVQIIGVEAAGKGLETAEHAASLSKGRPGVLHGARTYLLQDEEGELLPAYSISAGLDYPGVGPELAYLQETGRASFVSIRDEEALEAVLLCNRLEGILPALESAHALAYTFKIAKEEVNPIIVNLSGRGDKDIFTLQKYVK